MVQWFGIDDADSDNTSNKNNDNNNTNNEDNNDNKNDSNEGKKTDNCQSKVNFKPSTTCIIPNYINEEC